MNGGERAGESKVFKCMMFNQPITVGTQKFKQNRTLNCE